MRKKIEILSINQNTTDAGCNVTFGIKIGGKPYDLVYKITGGGVNSVPERCDAIVVTFLFFAIRHGMDICSKYPISEKLYYNICKHIIPMVCHNNENAHKIVVDVPAIKEKYDATFNGTGVSLGVDSFATIHEYLEDDLPKDYKLTHLVHLKTGAHHGQIGYFDKEIEDRLFVVENTKVKSYCEKYGYNLITVESNLFEVCCSEFGWNFDTTHIVRNLGTILLLQNYFGKYYYASALPQDSIRINIKQDQAYYEKWLIPLIATENIDFYSANGVMSRCEKIKYIAQFNDTYDNLHVCWHESENCGKCSKCIRTLVQLDLVGALDKYKESFDVDYYQKNRNKYINYVFINKHKDPSFYEIYLYMKNNGIKMPSAFSIELWRIKFLWAKVVRRIKAILKK